MWEKEDVGRIGVEVYYTGRQRLEVNPYATESEPYVIVGLLAERQFGRCAAVHQRRESDRRQADRSGIRWSGRRLASTAAWTVDAWAPLEGRNINGGVRLRF